MNKAQEVEKVLVDLIAHVKKNNFKNEALEELHGRYKKIITNHINTISKLKLFDANIEKLKESIILQLDKKYIPKSPKPKKVLTDEQLKQKKEKEKLRREKRKQDKENGIEYIKRKKHDCTQFIIPILHPIE